MKFDEALMLIGEFGTYQKRLYFLICLPIINTGIFSVISVLLLGTPDLSIFFNSKICAIPGLENDTYAVQNQYHQTLINKHIPPPSDDTLTYDDCHVYPSNTSDYGNYSRPINVSAKSCDKWVYDDSVFDSTFLSQKNLVCDQSLLPSVAKMLYFAGALVGSFLFGIISDMIGRKKTFLIANVLQCISSVALAWVDSYHLFVLFRFLGGAANEGVYMTIFVIGMELVGPNKRLWAGIVVGYFYAFGLIILAGIGYGLRDWRYMEMVVSFPNILYFFYIWLIPESPRWLLSKGRIEETEAILRKAATVNKATLPVKLFDPEPDNSDAPKGNLISLFTTKVMAVRTLVIFFNWVVVVMVYYGLSLNTANLGGNFYLNFTISGLVEFPAYAICILLLDRIGRQKLHVISMVLGGVACISTVFTTLYASEDLQVITVVLAMIGKLGAATAFAIIYVYSAELYPTVVRNAGMGASSCCARIGGMAAPYIADLNKVVPGDFGHALPLVVFGGASVAAGLLTLFLPETLHRDLPETIQDAVNFGKLPSVRKGKEVYINEDNKLDVLDDADGNGTKQQMLLQSR